MKTKFLLLFSLIILFNCSKEDDENTENIVGSLSNISIDNNNVNTYEVATINVNNVNLDDTYQATFAGETVTLTKVNENTLSFLLPDVVNGTYSLDSELGTIELEVTETTLATSNEEVINNFKNSIETNFTPTETKTKSEGAEILENILSNATEDEKQAIALYFEANKDIFNEIIALPSIAAKSTINNDLIKKVGNYNINVFKLGIGGVAVYGAAGLGTTGIGAILAGAGLGLMYDAIQDTVNNVDDMINTSVKMIDYNYIESSLKKNTLTTNTSFAFNNNLAKTLNANQSKRSLNQSDRTSTLYFFDTFFSTYDTFDSIISKMNTVINLANEIPFVNISLLQNNSIPTNGNVTNTNITSTDFSNYSFSITNDKISVTSSFQEDGKINLTLTANESLNLSEDIETQLIITYKDDFNELSKSFDIVLNKEEDNPYIGNWTAIGFNNAFQIGELVKSGYIASCDFYTEQWTINSASISITEETINLTVSQRTGGSGFTQNEQGVVDCDSIELSFDNDSFNISESYSIENNIFQLTSNNNNLDCEGESGISFSASVSNNLLTIQICELTLTFSK